MTKAFNYLEELIITWWEASSNEDKHLMTTIKFGVKASYRKLNGKQIKQLHVEYGSKKPSNANKKKLKR